MASLHPRPGILDIAPYVPGEARLPGVDTVIKLASNEGALGPSPAAVAALGAAGAELHRYPDGSCLALRRALADTYRLDPERIVCGNGSDQLISMLCRAYAGPGDEVLFSAHGFAWYPIVARAAGAVPVAAPESDLHADVDALLERVTTRTRLVFLANPNNPTGTMLPRDEIMRLHRGLPEDVLLVLDTAYAEYADTPEYCYGFTLVDAPAGNVVVTRTFSKLYALGALRIGWAYCPSGVADVMNRLRAPFNVNAAAQAAALAALNDRLWAAHTLRHTWEWRERLRSHVLGLGLEAPPSWANFVLARFPAHGGRTAAEADAFLRGRGIIVRPQGASGLPDALRISIGREDEMTALLEALSAFMERTPVN